MWLLVLEIFFGLVELGGFCYIIDQLKYILDYKRDERMAYEYSKQSKEELFHILDDPGNSPL